MSVAACWQELAKHGIVVLLLLPYIVQFLLVHMVSARCFSYDRSNKGLVDFKGCVRLPVKDLRKFLNRCLHNVTFVASDRQNF
jgi:hypothetical protein